MKVILGNSNTKWGVIIRPQSSNTYRHVLSFDTPALKDAFINKYIMQDKGDYKQELDNSYNRGVVELDALNIEFRVNVDEYPYETFNTLLNKDFCITKDEHGEIKFYAIKDAKRKGNIIQYVAEIDIFFTHDIKTIFNDDVETEIVKGMEDRVYKDEHGTIKWFFDKDSNDFKNVIYNPEDLGVNPNVLLNTKDEQIKVDYTSYIGTTKESEYPDEWKPLTLSNSKLNILMNNLLWDTWKVKNKNADGFLGVGQREPYDTMITYSGLGIDKMENESTKQWDVEIWRYTQKDKNSPLGYHQLSFADIDLSSPDLMKNSRTTFNINPFLNFYELGQNGIDLEIWEREDKSNPPFSKKKVVVLIKNGSVENYLQPIWTNTSVATDFSCYWKLKGLNRWIDSGNFLNTDKTLTKFDTQIKLYPDPSNFNIDSVVSNKHENEIKSHFAPFVQYRLQTISNNFIDLSPQYFTNKKLEFNSYYTYMTDSWQTLTLPIHYKDIISPLDLKNTEYLRDITTYQRATTTDAYEEWIIRNKSQYNAGLLSSKLSAGIGGAGALGSAIAGFASGNPMQAIGGLFGGISFATNSAMNIKKQLAMKEDLLRTPQQINATSSSIIADITLFKMQTTITKRELEPFEQILVREHFYKYGYNFQNKFGKLKDLINTRYYFNYIECPETFENISMQLSASTKQIINDSVANGLTIWHVRDLNTFKGIKNYNYENVEMSVL